MNWSTVKRLQEIFEKSKGDDLERAERCFRGMTDQQLDSPHGQSGMTRRELLDKLRRDRAEWQKVKDFVDGLAIKQPK